LRKNTPWKCSAEKQEAFVTLRDKFAKTIHPVHPNEDLIYIINTDASARAIGAVLLQLDRERDTNIESTASRGLTQTEQYELGNFGVA
jgi:hypothetical protein